MPGYSALCVGMRAFVPGDRVLHLGRLDFMPGDRARYFHKRDFMPAEVRLCFGSMPRLSACREPSVSRQTAACGCSFRVDGWPVHLKNFLCASLGRAKQARYLSHAKTNTDGTKPAATTMMTRAPAFGLAAGDGGAFVRSGLTRTTTDKQKHEVPDKYQNRG